MRKQFVFCLVTLFLVALLGTTGFAATVTVDPSGGGNYLKVRDAIGDYGTWSNSSGDAIELVDGVHLVAEADGNDTPPPLAGGAGDTLTIKSAAGASPIIAMDPADPPSRILFVRRTGTYILDGLTFIGADGVVQDDSAGVNRSCIQADGDALGQDVRLIMRDCVITRNTGSNVPDFDYTHAIPVSGATAGTYRRGFYVGEAAADGDLTVTIEDCVMAYTSNGAGAMRIERDPAAGAIRNFTFRNTLFVGNRVRVLLCTHADTNSTFNFEKCACVNVPNETLLFADRTFGPTVNISDTIFAPAPAGNDSQLRVLDSSFLSNLTVERCTFSTNNSDVINFSGAGGSPGAENVVLLECIEFDGDSAFRYNEPGFPASLVVSRIASYAPIRGSQDATIRQVFAEDFGTAGPLTHDPIFENTTFDNTLFANIRRWDSTSNNFLDVTNPSYLARNPDGSDLTGGAEFSDNLAGANRTCVTVDPGGTPVAGVLYNTIADAIDNHRNGDAWSAGNDCIELVNGVHLVGNHQNSNTPDPSIGNGVLTIRAQNPGNAVVALDPADIPTVMFFFRSNGTFMLEGLTLIGADGVVSNDGGVNRTCVAADGDDPDLFVEVILRDCAITQNSGDNVPNLDYSGAAATGTLTGTFRRGLYNGGAEKRGPCRLTFECGIVAYCQNGDGCVQIERGAGDYGAKVDWIFRNVLFAGNQSRALRITNGADTTDLAGDGQAGTTLDFEECCFANHSAETILLSGSVFGPTLNFSDCIFAPLPAGNEPAIVSTDSSFFNLSVVGATFVSDNNDQIRFAGAGGQPGQDNIVLKDIIEWDAGSLFRYEPDGAFPNSLNVFEGVSSNNAASSPHNHVSILNAFSSLYGGSGPITDNPNFVTTTFDDTIFANIRKWDSTTNDFADVGNDASYAGQGGGGSNLTGAAECPTCPFIGLSANPSMIDFGVAGIGGSSLESLVDLLNTGATVNIGSVSIVGPNASEFAITSDSGEGTLNTNQSRTLGITFFPTTLGGKTADLQILSDDVENPTILAPLSGTAANVSGIDDWRLYK
jgi:hypothetical protein